MEKCDKCGEFIEFARLCPLCAHYEKERLKRSAKKCEERARKAESLTRELVETLEMVFDLLEHHQPNWYIWAHFHQINNALESYKETMGDISKCAKCGKELRDCIYLLDGEDVCRDCFTKAYLAAIYDSEEPKLSRLICPKCKGMREER